jgi:hypothetical protein
MPRRATIFWPYPVIRLCVFLCATLNAGIALWAIRTRPSLNSDFLAFWSFPRFAAAFPVAGLYNADKLTAFQQTLYPGFHSFYPFLYPPTFLLASWWLNFCSFPTAQALWTAGGLAALIAATWALFPPGWRAAALLAMLGSPASLLNFMTGETAYFTTALLLAGFALLPKRPLLAGIAFGLLTLKPQLGVLIPLALLARGDWRAIAAAAITALALVALSCAAFPPDLWLIWARTLPAYQADYFAATGLNLNIIVTPAANLVSLGAPPRIAWLVQAASALVVAIAVFWAFRQRKYPLAVATLLCGGFLAVPHAYAYDSITLTAAMALCLLSTPTPAWLRALGVLTYLAPLLLLSSAAHWFLYAAPEALLFAGIILLARHNPIGAQQAHEQQHHLA